MPLHKDRSMDLRWAVARSIKQPILPAFLCCSSGSATTSPSAELPWDFSLRSVPADLQTPKPSVASVNIQNSQIPSCRPHRRVCAGPGKIGRSTCGPTLSDRLWHSYHSISAASYDCLLPALVGGLCSEERQLFDLSGAPANRLAEQFSPNAHKKIDVRR